MSELKTLPLSKAFWFQEGPGVRKWQFTSSGVKLLNVANIEKSGNLNLEKTDRHLDEAEVASKYSHFLVDAGDLVIASSGISFDEDGLLRTRGAFVEEVHLPLCLNTSTIRFKAQEGVSDLRFLRLWLDSQEFRVQITKLVTGSAQQNFGPSHLKALQITLPPIAHQKRIAAILDQAKALRSYRREAIGLLDELGRSVFLEMFGDPVTNPKGWNKVPFSELLSAIESGKSPNCLDRPAIEGEWGVLKLGAVTWCEYNPLENKALPPQEKTDPTYEVKVGDLLFTRKNTYDLVAACVLVRNTPTRLLLPDLIFRFCLKPDALIDSCFLHQLLIEPRKRREMQKLASGSSSSMPNISKAKLQTVLIEVPPLPLQQQFAQRIAAIEALKATQREAIVQLDRLFASLQHRAFRGEL